MNNSGEMELCLKTLSNFLLVVIVSSFFRTSQASLNRDLLGVSFGNFEKDESSFLNITSIDSKLIEDAIECGFACLEISSCFSYNLYAFPDVNRKLLCELLPSDKYNNSDKFITSPLFHHFSIPSPCSSWPCQNNGTCILNYAKKNYACHCIKGFTGKHCQTSTCKFDFENGLDGWVKTGDAFDNQPTYGDNPTARNRGQPANQQGDWWIGTYENRPSPSDQAGETQGDAPKGTLTSPIFTIMGGNITFLIGGGCNDSMARAELIIDDKVVESATGNCTETMHREIWDVTGFYGQRAQVRLVDDSSAVWSHINFDDLKGDITCGQD